MSLASQIQLYATRVATEFKSVRTALTGKADLSGGVVTNTQMPNGLRSTENASTVVTDLNNATGNGFWRGESTALNTPVANSYFHVQVINLGGDWILQIAYQINPAGGYSGMWMRRFENSSAWTAWQKCWVTQTELDARYAQSANMDTAVRYSRMHEVLSGGGQISWDGTYLKWTSRFIVMPMHTNTYLDVNMPAAGYSITALGAVGDEANGPLRPSNLAVTAAGIKMNFWMALYFRFSDGKFYMGTYNTGAWTNNHDFLLIAVHNADGNFIRLGNGLQVAGNQTIDTSHPYYSQAENDSRYATTAGTTTALAAKADLSSGLLLNTQIPPRLAAGGYGVPTGNDWNGATDTGWYSASGAANAPGGWTGWVIVEVQQLASNPAYVSQEARQMALGTGVVPGFTYRRLRDNGTWSAWTLEWDARYMLATAKLNTLSASGDVTFNGYRATTLADPTAATDAATKQYVDNHTWGASRLAADVKPTQAGGTAIVSDLALRAIGGTAGTAMSGAATLDTIPVAGPVPFGSYRATGLGEPVNTQDATTKNYVDTRVMSDGQMPARLRTNVQANPINDANNAIFSGYWYVPNISTSHSPDIATDWYIHVVAYSNTTVTQTAHDRTNRVFTRALNVDTGSWTSWVRLAQVVDTGWVTLPLAANWQNYPGWQPAQYRKSGDWVELRGLIQRINSANPANTTILTVPVGGPTYNHMFPVIYIASSGAETVGRVDIQATTGALTSGNIIPTSGYVSLYNIRYSVI